MLKNKNTIGLLIVAIVIFFMGQECAEAATHWASPTGSAQWLNCESDTPLGGTSACSPSTVFTNASAGDTVNFRGGNYYFPQSTSWEVAPTGYSILNDGTENNPIIFQAYTGETPIFVGYYGVSNFMALMLTNGRTDQTGPHGTWFTLDGFTFEAYTGPNGTGNRVLPEIAFTSDQSDSELSALHITVENCEFIGNGTDNRITLQDNQHMIWIGGQNPGWGSYVTIRNNLFRDIYRASGYDDINGCAVIMPYTYHGDVGEYVHHITITNNEFRNCVAAYYMKGNGNPASNITFAYNYVNGCERGFSMSNNGDGHNMIHDNIFRLVRDTTTDNLYGVNAGYQGESDSDEIYNNTIYTEDTVSGGSGGVQGEFTHLSLHDNIIHLTAVGMGYDNGEVWGKNNAGPESYSEISYNNFSRSPFLARFLNTSYTTIPALEAATITVDTNNLCSSRHPCGNISLDPQFVNSSGSYSSISDFALQSGSPSEGTGRGGADMGANVALVGIQSNSSDTLPPASPHGLAVY